MRKIGILGFVAISTVISGCATPAGVQTGGVKQPMSVASVESSTKIEPKQSPSPAGRSARFVVLRMLDVKQSSDYVAQYRARQDMSSIYCNAAHKLRASDQYLNQPVVVVYVARCDKSNRLTALAAAHAPMLNRDQKYVLADDSFYPTSTFGQGSAGAATFPVKPDGSIENNALDRNVKSAFSTYYQYPKPGHAGFFSLYLPDHFLSTVRGVSSSFPSKPTWGDGTELQPAQMAYIALMTLAETNSAGAALAGLLEANGHQKSIANIPQNEVALNIANVIAKAKERVDYAESAARLAEERAKVPATYARALVYLNSLSVAPSWAQTKAGFGAVIPLDQNDRCGKAVIETIAKLNREHTTLVTRIDGKDYNRYKDKYQSYFHVRAVTQLNANKNVDFDSYVKSTSGDNPRRQARVDILINQSCTSAIVRVLEVGTHWAAEGGTGKHYGMSVAQIDADFRQTRQQGKVVKQFFRNEGFSRGNGSIEDFRFSCAAETCKKL